MLNEIVLDALKPLTNDEHVTFNEQSTPVGAFDFVGNQKQKPSTARDSEAIEQRTRFRGARALRAVFAFARACAIAAHAFCCRCRRRRHREVQSICHKRKNDRIHSTEDGSQRTLPANLFTEREHKPGAQYQARLRTYARGRTIGVARALFAAIGKHAIACAFRTQQPKLLKLCNTTQHNVPVASHCEPAGQARVPFV